MAIGNLWKAENKYVVQFSQVRPKDKRIILNNFRDWKPSGAGFHKDGTEVFIFSSTSIEESEIFSLVKNMPFPFTEEKKSGKKKKIRTKHIQKSKDLTDSKISAKIRKATTCSKCGTEGHNSRTCKV